jgi:hypothetical protein
MQGGRKVLKVIIVILVCFFISTLITPEEKMETKLKEVDLQTKKRLDEIDDDLDKY